MTGIKNKAIFAIVGPTASGKTALGVELALKLGNGEVVNCDSVQIYRSIQIATAKPSDQEMKGVPHHLISYVDPSINYTAANWAEDAARKIVEIEARGGTAILVGGTGFYLRTLRKPLFEGPRTDPGLRKRLSEIRERKGPEHLHLILQRVDPKSAERLFPRDYPRVQRALEVYFQTGKRLSEVQKKRSAPPAFAGRIRIFALNPPREELYQKINARSAAHFESGLIEEVRRLREEGLRDDTNALGSHGYRRACEYLRGEKTIEQAVAKTQQDVRNYAKRQLSWFRGEPDIAWLEGFGNENHVREALFAMVKEADRKFL
ncbi:MAG: tRNA (adenosine(37)-N6)-dimethylallyltransferase MiaA [Acidobacteriota bacterium]|nr:tRNA (adenosine(37)-N6)-dimethylallyltransferase MiaA [Acidobacteriota bacterium]MDH3530414.1 tRNA (adenosine(37)-N6)-dimethylallyltransferase MiaA [Acidobacteriota bacterium]